MMGWERGGLLGAMVVMRIVYSRLIVCYRGGRGDVIWKGIYSDWVSDCDYNDM